MISPSDPGKQLGKVLSSCGDPLGEVMAKKLHVTPMTVYRWKNSKDLKVSRLIQICNYFGMSIDEFLDWEEEL